MSGRPLCRMAVLLMVLIFFADCAGWSRLWKSPAGGAPFFWAQEDQEAGAAGILYAKEEKASVTYLYLKQTSLTKQSEKYPIRNIKCIVKGSVLPETGDYVWLRGRLTIPDTPGNPGQFNEYRYAASDKIDFYLEDACILHSERTAGKVSVLLQQAKDKLRDNLERMFPEREAGILCAVLLGEKQMLEEEVREQYQTAGISHILAISGFHISLIGMGVWTALLWLGMPAVLAAAGMTGLLTMYGMLIGSPASAFRAILMCIFLTGARLLGRSYDRMSALALAAILLLLDNPDLLFYSGFQLSFLAVLGLELWSGMIKEMLEQGLGKRKWTVSVSGSLAIWFMTLPVVLNSFYQVSVLSVLCNLLILPFFPVLVVCSLAALFLSLVHLTLGSAVGVLAYFILRLYGFLTEYTDRIPFAVWTPGQPDKLQIVMYYMLLGGVHVRVSRQIRREKTKGTDRKKRTDKTKKPAKIFRKEISTGLLLALTGIGCIILMADWDRPVSRLTMLDVGQGESIVLQARTARVLLDGGSTSKKKTGKYVILPYLKQQGIAHLDAVFVTHPDEDHINGITEVLQETQRSWFTVDMLLMPEWMKESEKGIELMTMARQADISCDFLSAGDEVTLGGQSFSVLAPRAGEAPADSNAGSLVLWWRTESMRALLTGDLPLEAEQGLLQIPACEILKVAHHGSEYATSEGMLEKVQPEIALISCGENNRYGHPGDGLLGRLEKYGAVIYRTDRDGAITIDH